ncbi:MAG: hypothetical protein RRB22_05270 [Gammaproteobacteria bacterium]|nr:hypothetical protein [Gammaproteobacteria bacterium]
MERMASTTSRVVMDGPCMNSGFIALLLRVALEARGVEMLWPMPGRAA